ncbi:MAG: hypothetical protein ISS71_10115 [Phycisphaerae bacterium]|nr:hypothetical protein [Phycisphaerae bacterium]
MNRAQKTAWMNLITGFIWVIVMGLASYYLMKDPTSAVFRLLAIVSGIVFLFLLGFIAFVLSKKQSPVEPATDERDRLINRRAIQIAFVGLCILMFLATALPMWICGMDSSIPTVVLPLINMIVFLVTLTIYNAAVLILYGAKGGPA